MTISKYKMLTIADGGSLYALEKKGNLPHVETLYNPGNYFSEVHIIVFDSRDLSVHLKNPTLKVHYIRHLDFGKLGFALSLPWMLLQILAIIYRNKIHIIRARNAYVAGMFGILAGKIMRIPVVVSLGGNNRLAQELCNHYYLGSRFVSFFIEEFSIRCADRIFSVNKFTAEYAKDLGAETSNIRIVPHCIEVDPLSYEYDSIKARAEFGLDGDRVVVIIGRLEADKQVDCVIEAIPAVYQYHPDIKFVLVGDGSLRPKLEKRTKALAVNTAVKFVGFAARQDVIKHLAAAEIVCIPMSGFVIYEAAAAKKPIVAFDVEWHSEFIEDGKTGRLVKNRDTQALAQVICSLLSDPTYAKQLGCNANQKLREKFNRKNLIDNEIKQYQELLRQ